MFEFEPISDGMKREILSQRQDLSLFRRLQKIMIVQELENIIRTSKSDEDAWNRINFVKGMINCSYDIICERIAKELDKGV